ncbi:Tumor necrosis factor ligand superfamily member 13 [Varanus komodoensis]|uniref:THD domain-containing protein n=1 Tax=Varanus komodoensis TaxID=61221 RepID=A0A8D2Q9A4_VARKO|nr:Tumor necrosis factor ligand superfamily member 13 [Varanus komodoensis]
MAGARPRRGPCRHASLLAAAWAGTGVLAVGFLACLFALWSLQCRLEVLREELVQLRGELRARMPGPPGRLPGTPEPLLRAGDFLGPCATREKLPRHLERRKRDVERTSQEQLRQRRKQSALHLVPERQANKDGECITEVWWKPFLQQGRALELSGRDVLVKHTGLYLVYSQVLFHDPTFTMGQVLQRLAPGRPNQVLFRCIQSMPADPERAYNSCYSGGVFHLQHGDRLNLYIPRCNASFDFSAHGTFLGLLRL